jgi:hypothetical protein
MSSAPNGHDRSITPAYALSSELQAVKEYGVQNGHNTWRNTARIEHLENLLNGIEERLARRTGAQIELQLSPVAKEMHALRVELCAMRDEQRREAQELRAGIFEALGVAKSAEKDARHAIREAEMASGTNEVTGQFAQLAVDEKRADLKAQEQRQDLLIRAAKWVGGSIAGTGVIGLVVAAIMQSCGG